MIIQNIDRIIRAKDYEQMGKNILVTSMFYTIQGEGPFAGHPAVFLRLAGCNFGNKSTTGSCLWCFPSSTSIYTPSGKTLIGNISPGDSLYALDDTGNLVTTTVRKVLSRNVDQNELVQIKYHLPGLKEDKKLIVTRDHPFHTTKRGFISAANLKVGEKIYHVNSRDLISHYMSNKNPMRDEKIRNRVHKNLRNKRKLGLLKPYVRTPEINEKIALSKRGSKNPMKRHDVRLKSALGHSYPKSNLERKFEKAFDLLELNCIYTGNTGELYVGDSNLGYKFPDFLLSENKVLEVYDTTFKYLNTKSGKRHRRTVKNYENPVRKFYEAFGYEVLFLTDKDLPKVGQGNSFTKASYSPLKQKIKKFLRNGAVVTEISEVSSTAWNKLRGNKSQVEVKNFSCFPYNTFVIGNLHTHNCDTNFRFDEGKAYSPEDLQLRLQDLKSKSDLLVVTGGEPTLQINLLDLIELSHSVFPKIQIESNGTQAFFFNEMEARGIDYVTIVVSPKANYKANRYAPLSKTVLKHTYCLKFVIEANPDSPHHTIPDWAFESGVPVYVSPMAIYQRAYKGEVSSIWEDGLIDREATAKNYAYAAEYAMKHGLMLSLQTHLFLGVA